MSFPCAVLPWEEPRGGLIHLLAAFLREMIDLRRVVFHKGIGDIVVPVIFHKPLVERIDGVSALLPAAEYEGRDAVSAISSQSAKNSSIVAGISQPCSANIFLL